MAELPSFRAAFRTKRELAIDTLRTAINSGRYAPGQSLRQVQLVKDLGLGSTPVREAVLELLARGVLVQESHHSVRVVELDLDRLRNIYRVRALLETEAAQLGTAKISDDAIGVMKAQLQRMSDGKRSGDIDAVAAADMSFRLTLFAAAGNPILFDLIEQTWNLFPEISSGTFRDGLRNRSRSIAQFSTPLFNAIRPPRAMPLKIIS